MRVFRRKWRRILIGAVAIVATATVVGAGWSVSHLAASMQRIQASAAESSEFPTVPSASKNAVGEAAAQCTLQDGQPTGEYASFPAVTRAGDGRVFAVWRVAEGHQFGTGKLMLADHAPRAHPCSWSPPREIYVNPDAGYTVSVGGIAITPDGIMVVSLVRYRTLSENQARDFRSFAIRSTDGGRHWTSPQEMSAGFAGQSYPSSLITMDDGSLLMALYGNDSPTAYKGWYARVARSTDGGQSWQPHGEPIRSAQAEFTEPQLLLDGSRILMTLRHDSDDSGTFLTESTNSGQNFSAPRRISSGNSGMPTVAKLPDGRFIFAYRAAGGPFRYAASTDLQTWTMDLDATAGSQRRMLHAGFAAGVDNQTVVVYALENPEGDPNAWASVYVATI